VLDGKQAQKDKVYYEGFDRWDRGAAIDRFGTTRLLTNPIAYKKVIKNRA